MKLTTIALFLIGSLSAQHLTYERILNSGKEPGNWLTYHGDYRALRHRDLGQINAETVGKLRVEWIYQTGQSGSMQTVPLVVDGVMYITAGDGVAMALDPKTGREFWRYKYNRPADQKLCCGTVNRGLAMLGSRLFMTTPDAHIVAIDARNGKQLWDTEMGDWRKGYGATVAPLVVKNKIISGVAGGEFGIRGFVDAYEPETGKRIWRFWTIPSKDEPGGDSWLADSWERGGGATWTTGTWDADLNTLYWAVGNPGPDLFGESRKGDNLFTCSILALDPDTGKRKWHFQFTPHDLHDWDANEVPMLADLPWQGTPRKLLLLPNRNGFYYILDRTNGAFLKGQPFWKQTWAKGLDEKGRPVLAGSPEPSPEGNKQCPGLAGATNWMSPSYNPQTKLYYFQIREGCDVYYSAPPAYIAGKPFWGSVFRGASDERAAGRIRAMDPVTMEMKWEFRLDKAPWAGTLSTSGNLIFAGDEDGYLMALDARNGNLLWKLNTGSRLVSAPITYMIDGRQYVTMPSGSALLTFALPE